jgi:hypothetical protein
MYCMLGRGILRCIDCIGILSGGGKGIMKIYNKLIRDNIPEIMDAKGVNLEAFESIRVTKKEKRGGFGKKLLLEYTEEEQ